MRKTRVVLATFLVLLMVSSAVMAYESDRMDFGPIDFGGATVTFVAHFDNLSAFYEGGARAGRLEGKRQSEYTYQLLVCDEIMNPSS
ncbi:MAG: hypothetical protein GX331_10860 [Firmicutes bacterium]|nr:hypothetical protein [Bacillota bacterium]